MAPAEPEAAPRELEASREGLLLPEAHRPLLLLLLLPLTEPCRPGEQLLLWLCHMLALTVPVL